MLPAKSGAKAKCVLAQKEKGCVMETKGWVQRWSDFVTKKRGVTKFARWSFVLRTAGRMCLMLVLSQVVLGGCVAIQATRPGELEVGPMSDKMVAFKEPIQRLVIAPTDGVKANQADAAVLHGILTGTGAFPEVLLAMNGGSIPTAADHILIFTCGRAAAQVEMGALLGIKQIDSILTADVGVYAVKNGAVSAPVWKAKHKAFIKGFGEHDPALREKFLRNLAETIVNDYGAYRAAQTPIKSLAEKK